MTHPIFVTGPQRSGTRLAAQIIARETGRKFIDETEYNFDIPMNSVVQAPFLLKAVFELSFVFPTAEFAFMYRNIDDIVSSLERVEWYKDYIDSPDFYKKYINHNYQFIEQLKAELPKDRWFDIKYESLSHDPLFVTDRSNFTTKQYLPDTPDGPKTWRNDEHLRTT